MKMKPEHDEEMSVANRLNAQRLGVTLRNLLKLPKAHKWVCFEFFYSNIDKYKVNPVLLLFIQFFQGFVPRRKRFQCLLERVFSSAENKKVGKSGVVQGRCSSTG
jgi:hypothetical protein